MSTSDPKTRDLSSLRIDRDPPTAAGERRPRRWWWLALPVVLITAAAATLMLRDRGIEVRVAEANATGGASAAGGGIAANGYVVARTKASVSAKIPGRLAFLGVTEGSRVRRGEVIARIESADYLANLRAVRAAVGQTEAQLVQARRDLERALALKARNVISELEAENAETRLRVLEAQLHADRARVAMAEATLENTNVRAPFDGTVLRKDAEVGEIVAPSSAGGGLTRTAIVTMADLGTLEVEVDVNEAYIARVRGGQDARVTLDAYPDTSFAGRVRQVVPTADRQKATVLVKVAILDRDPRILPEMAAKVVFESGAEPVGAAPRQVTVPAAAVVGEGATARVWVVEKQRVTARAVETGRASGDRVEIRSGLAGGERVVVAPPAGLRDGRKVRPASES
jgi:RND family efflux transporter MFP subunit